MDVDSNAADLSVWDPSSAWNPPQTEKVEPDHARLELVEAMRGYVLFKEPQLEGTLLTRFAGY